MYVYYICMDVGVLKSVRRHGSTSILVEQAGARKSCKKKV